MPRNCKGFTLLEVMFSFSIFLTIVAFFPPLIKIIAFDKITPPYEIELFYQQIGIDIREAERIEINGNTLLLYSSKGQVVSIEYASPVIRRRVDFKGHEVLVQSIKKVSFRRSNNGIEVVLIDFMDNRYDRRLSMAPLDWGD